MRPGATVRFARKNCERSQPWWANLAKQSRIGASMPVAVVNVRVVGV